MPDSVRRHVPVSLGDALLVEAHLSPDANARDAIEELLGIDRTAMPQGRMAVGPWKPNEPTAMNAAATRPARVAGAAAPLATVAAPPTLLGSATTASFVGRITFDHPDWTAGTHAFQPAAGDDGSLPAPPLFATPHARALLLSIVATFHDGPEVDVDRVSALVAEGRRVETIPYIPVLTRRRGTQLLVDRGDAMDPLRDDLEQVKAELLRLFGRGHLEVFEFAHCPSARESQRRGLSVGPRARPMPWRSPGRGVPVLIVSDFSLSTAVADDVDNATAAEWQEFAGDVLAAGCHPVGLVPYPPSRWPPALARAITFVHWSERTTARQVVRALRETRRSAAPV